MNDNLVLLQYYNNIDLLLDRFILFVVLFLYLVVGSLTRNVLFKKELTGLQIIVASVFNSLYLTLLSDVLIKLFKNFFFSMVLLLGLIQKEFISSIKNSNKLKKFVSFLTGEKESVKNENEDD